MFLFHFLNDFCKILLGVQIFDSCFMALPLLWWDRASFGGHFQTVRGVVALQRITKQKNEMPKMVSVGESKPNLASSNVVMKYGSGWIVNIELEDERRSKQVIA